MNVGCVVDEVAVHLHFEQKHVDGHQHRVKLDVLVRQFPAAMLYQVGVGAVVVVVVVVDDSVLGEEDRVGAWRGWVWAGGEARACSLTHRERRMLPPP